MWQQGSLVELELTDLASNGSAVGRYKDRVVFVPNGVPGDRVLSRLIKVKPAYAEGKITTIIASSPERVQPFCILADKCGGCQWQQVTETLRRVGGLDEEVSEILASTPLGYRNKVIYPLGKGKDGGIKVGYYQKGTHKIVNLNSCPVEDPRLDEILPRIKESLSQWEVYDEVKKTGKLRHLCLRIGQFTGEILVTLVGTSWQLENLQKQGENWRAEFPSIVGVCLNLNNDLSTNRVFGTQTIVVSGSGFIYEKFCGLDLLINSTAFFQVNTYQAERMVLLMMELLELKGDEVIVDGYAGIGTMILPIAKQFPHSLCWAIDSYSESIQCAQQNAQINQITNINFIVSKFEDALAELSPQPDVVLLDPPRKGCDERVLTGLMQTQPDQIVYVSCKASTLARDLKILKQSEIYNIERIIPIDLFPQTSHLETIVLLRKQDKV